MKSIDLKHPVTIALDAMGADNGPEVVVSAAVDAVAHHRYLSVDLVGDAVRLESLVPAAAERIRICPASEVVTMDDSPADAVRRKKNSSMRVAIERVKNGAAAACVSAGNTGALMATAKFVLKTLPGIKRPAILAELPTRRNPTYLLDVGANAECDADQLFQFAVMGSIVASQLSDSTSPSIALLNIGSESQKGDGLIQEASALIEASGLNYVGFVEGNDLGQGNVDVVVTDGFTGNVALKTMEGTASLVSHFANHVFTRSWFSKLQGLVARRALNQLRTTLDPRGYNGASFVGLNGIVVKSHGGADEVAFGHAIQTALLEVSDNTPAAIDRWMKNEAA
ncbi:MAG: phosphate acyltransferase PlsX [Pseudomonadota bacterium]